jgi:hypothetical protein
VPDGRIIIVSGFDLARSEELLRSGADGHLIKDTPLKDIVAYIEGKLGD